MPTPHEVGVAQKKHAKQNVWRVFTELYPATASDELLFDHPNIPEDNWIAVVLKEQ